jgi:hypothetical protein
MLRHDIACTTTIWMEWRVAPTHLNVGVLHPRAAANKTPITFSGPIKGGAHEKDAY